MRRRPLLAPFGRTLRWAAAATALVALCALLAPATAAAKSYSIPTCDIQAKVAANGDLTVDMRQSFDFSGSFTYVFWVIDKKGARRIDVLGVDGPGGPATLTRDVAGRPPGTYSVSDQGSAVTVDTFFNLTDASAAFTLHYRAVGAAVRYTDTAELYWKFIGQDAWTVPMDNVRALVTLPGHVAAADVRAWGHGPLQGVVKIQPDGSVLYKVSPLEQGAMLEARILFPTAALSKASQVDQAVVATVLQQEQKLADQANAQRDQARADRNRAHAGGWIAGLVNVGALVALVITWFKKGREHKVSLPGEYFRDIPSDLPPAIVDYLWNMGEVDTNAISATIVDLANRGVVRIEPATVDGGFFHHDKQTYQLTLDTTKREGCGEIDKKLLDLLFATVAGAPVVTIPQIREYAQHNQAAFRAEHAAWRALVTQQGKDQHFMEPGGTAAAGAFVGVGVALFVSVWLLGGLMGAPLGYLGIPTGVVVVVASRTLKRRRREAAELHAKYRGLRNYMHDFGRMQEKPPTAVALWEQYLVLATVFGMADEVIADMKVKVPEVVQDPAFTTSMWWVGAHAVGSASFASAFSSGFNAAAAAASPKSSGGGGGGGFSGGGGGGAG
jgi:uncharacterized membrane protein